MTGHCVFWEALDSLSIFVFDFLAGVDLDEFCHGGDFRSLTGELGGEPDELVLDPFRILVVVLPSLAGGGHFGRDPRT